MFMNNFLRAKISFTLVIIQKIQRFFIRLIKKIIGKMKDEFGGVIVIEFVELKPKMHAMKKIDGKEYNTTKRVSIATEFNNSKMSYLMKKLLDTK